MVHFFNSDMEPNRNQMVNVHKFVDTTAIFTFSTGPLSNGSLCAFPSITIFDLTIPTIPVGVIFSTGSKFDTPFARTEWGAKGLHSLFEITHRTFKFITAIKAYFFPAISWACSAGRTFMVANLRAIFSFITDKGFKFFPAHQTHRDLRSNIVLFSHKYPLTHIYEIHKDYFYNYFNAAKERLERHQRQGVLTL